MTQRSLFTFALLLSAAFLRARPAAAQALDLTDGGRYLSQGVLVLPTSVATEQAPFALSINPANILFNSTGLAYVHEDGTKAETNGRRSDGLYFRLGGLNVGDTFGAAAGFSMEWIRPLGGGCPLTLPTCLRRISLGFAFGTPEVSFGGAYRWYSSAQSAAINGLGTFDLGLTVRPVRWLSMALEANAINAPSFEGEALPRLYTLGVGLRPLSDWLTMAVDFSVDDRGGWRGSRLSYLADAALPQGIDLLAQVGQEVEPGPAGQRLGVELGLRFSFGNGAFWAAMGDQVTNGSGGFSGAAAAELSLARGPALIPPLGEAVVLDLQDALKKPGTLSTLLGLKQGLDPYTKLVLHLEQLEHDRALETLVVEVRGLDGLSFGRVEELRSRLLELRAQGKKVLAWMESGGDREYYLATAANRIYVAPQAMLEINGLSTTHLYLRGLLDKIGVQPEFVKIGAYKSFPEEFTNTQSSAPAAEQTNSVLSDEFDRYVATIAHARNLPVAKVRAILSNGVFIAEDAVKDGLVDGLSSDGDALSPLADQLSGRKLLFTRAHFPDVLPQGWSSPDAIALVEVVGDIGSPSLDGIQQGVTAAEVVKQLEAAASDSRVKAIVLRVESPGGDVGASELIWQAVAAARRVKPVIASFGDVAASGGYYIASAAGTIFAEPSTITGSIGVFAGKANLAKLLGTVGVSTQTFKRGDHADLYTLARPWTPQEREIVSHMVGAFYETFLAHVAAGRGMTRDQVNAIAQGRVWTGAQAKVRGLVDRLGGLEDALREARREGGLPPQARVVIPGAKGYFDLPDLPATVARLQGRERSAIPPELAALRALLIAAGGSQAAEQAWPLVEGLLAARPMALAVDLPVAR